MSEILPTMKVKFKDGGNEALINVSDFDAKLHETLDGTAPVAASLTKAAISARLAELKVDFKPTQSKDELEALLKKAEEAAVPAPESKFRVVTKGDKFVVLSNETNQQSGGDFDTEEAAVNWQKML